MKKEKILLLGGTGFLGKNLKRKLVNKYSIDCIHFKKIKKIDTIKKINYIKFNLNHHSKYKKIFNKTYDYIINLSGYIDHDKKKININNIFKEHFLNTYNISNFFLNKKIKKFINIGSSDEYGNITKKKFLETDREDPISIYSLGKTCSAHYLKTLYNIFKLPTVTLRIFLAYGPGQDSVRFVPYVINKCLSKKKVIIHNNFKRDFCYVDDVVQAIILCLKSDKVNGEIFNIGSSMPISLYYLAKKISFLCNGGKIIIKGRQKNLRQQSKILVANTTKIKNILNWKPKIKLDIGLKRTINFYRSQNNAKY